jgi:glycosyltransferase involved in cell wall biosynthesis
VKRLETALRDGGIPSYELVLVGNYVEGSDDSTPRVVRELAAADPRIVCSAVAKRGMMGWDLRSGLRLASGTSLAIVDGDGQVLFEDLVRTYRELQGRELDLAMTYRLRRGDGLVRRLLSVGLNTLFRVLFPGTGVCDVNAKPKALRRAAYERLHLESDDWFIDAEIVIQARDLGLRVGQIPTEFLGLESRTSFVSLSAVAEFLRNLARHRWRELRRRGKW